MKEIPVLTKEAYRGPVRNISDGEGHTHIAKITDESGNKREVYANLYPEGSHPRSLVNEITAYLLASKMNLPTPSKAWIVLAPTASLKKLYPHIQFNNDGGDYPLWCTSKVAGKSAKTKYTIVTQSLRKDLQNWKAMPDVIAFDEWTANIDRNIGNLIRTSKSNYIIIDNEDIASGRNWHKLGLDPKVNHDNKLVRILFNKNSNISLPVKNKMVTAANDHQGAFKYAEPTLNQWWSSLLNEDDKVALCQFIGDRATDSVSSIGNRYKVIV
jgi:hypothetical protein